MARHGRPPELTGETKDRVVALYNEGIKIDDITAETGVRRPTIYFILKQRGLRPTRTARDTEVSVSTLLQELAAAERQIGRLQSAIREHCNTDLDEASLGLIEGDLG